MEMLERYNSFQSHNQATKFILLELTEIVAGKREVWPLLAKLGYIQPKVTTSNQSTLPLGDAPAGTSSGKEKNKKGKYVDEIQLVINRMNEHRPLTGKQQPFNWERWGSDITACLKAGKTVTELLLVADHKAAECKRSRDWDWYKPDTLYRIKSIDAKIGAAESGVVIKPFTSGPPKNHVQRMKEKQSDADYDDWSRIK